MKATTEYKAAVRLSKRLHGTLITPKSLHFFVEGYMRGRRKGARSK